LKETPKCLFGILLHGAWRIETEQRWSENLLAVLIVDDDEDYLLVTGAFEAGPAEVFFARFVNDVIKLMRWPEQEPWSNPEVNWQRHGDPKADL
jgi:hypothetical protein